MDVLQIKCSKNFNQAWPANLFKRSLSMYFLVNFEKMFQNNFKKHLGNYLILDVLRKIKKEQKKKKNSVSVLV